MKKLCIVCSLFMILILSSCGNKASREVIRDYPLDSIKETLALESVQNGKALNKDLDKSKAYFNVQIAEDAKSTLFYQSIPLDEYIDNRFKQINIRILYFNDQIPSTDATSFITEMNHKDYGLTEEGLEFSFNKVDEYSATLFGKLSLSYGLKLPKDYGKKENDKTALVVAYLPTYCTYNDGKQDYTKVFIMVPVYYAFAYESTIEDYTKNLKKFDVEVDDKGLLPSNPA